MKEEKEPIIFISYRRATCAEEAKAIYYRIRASDSTRKVFWDKMSIPVGTNWRQCFMDNIGHASLVTLLISKSTMETFKDNGEPDNVLLEWDIAVAKRKRGEVEILPVFLLEPGEDGFDFKGIAKHQTVSKDCSLSFEELWSAISEIQGIQIHFSGEYDLEALEGRINKLVPINKVVSTRIEAEKTVYSRQVKNPHGFVGREDILCAISAHFSNCNESAAVLLYGGPGMGKTTIVTKFAYTLKSASDSRYTHIFWISLVSRYSFQTSIKDLLGVLNLQVDSNFEKMRNEVFCWLAENKRYLIVFDNADDSEIVKVCLGELSGIGGHALITSRDSAIERFIPLEIDIKRKMRKEIEVWPEEVTLEYVNSRLDFRLPKSDVEKDFFTKTLNFMNGFPLIIEQMCSFLANRGGYSFRRYYQLLENQSQQIWDQAPDATMSDYDRTIDATFGIIIDQFKKAGHNAECIILGAIGCVSNKNIPIESYLRQFLIESDIEAEIDDVLSELIKVSLIKMDDEGNSISIHLAIQSVIRRNLRPDDWMSSFFEEIAILVMERLFPKPVNGTFDPSTLSIGTALIPHIYEIYTISMTRQRGRTIELASVLFDAASLAEYICSFEIARNLYSGSIQIYTENYGTRNHGTIAAAINCLGIIAKLQGNYGKAKEYYSEALTIKEKVYGFSPKATIAETINDLAEVAVFEGDYKKGISLYSKSLSISETVYGTRYHPSIANTLNKLADIAKLQGNYEEAKNLYSKSLIIYEKMYGTRQHFNIAITINRLGEIAEHQGLYKKAKRLYSESLSISEKLYNTQSSEKRGLLSNSEESKSVPSRSIIWVIFTEAKNLYCESRRILEGLYGKRPHPAIALTINNLGDICERTGDYEGAKILYIESLAISKVLYGTRPHPSIANTITNLGDIAERQGDYNEAKRLYTESLAISEKVYGSHQHPNIATIIKNLGDVAEVQGDYNRAQKMYMESLAIYEKVYGKRWHPGIAIIHNKLGEISERRSDYVSASKLYRESLAISEKVYNTRVHPDVATTINNLGEIALHQGNYSEARSLYSESLKLFEDVYGNQQHDSIATTLKGLGDVAFTQGDYNEAERVFVQCLDIKQNIFGTRLHVSVATTINDLGDIAFSRGDYKEAKKNYAEVLEIFDIIFGTKEHAEVAITMDKLGDIMMREGNYDQAETILNNSLRIKEKVYGTRGHVSVAVTIRLLGELANRNADFNTAITMVSESISIFHSVYGTLYHVNLAISKNILGDVARKDERYAVALKHYSEALSIYEAVYDTRKHPNTGVTINNLAIVARHLCNFDEAIKLHLEALAIFENVFENKHHPDIANLLYSLGATFEASGDLESAKLKYGESLEIFATSFDTQHPSYVEVYVALGNLDTKLGRKSFLSKFGFAKKKREK